MNNILFKSLLSLIALVLVLALALFLPAGIVGTHILLKTETSSEAQLPHPLGRRQSRQSQPHPVPIPDEDHAPARDDRLVCGGRGTDASLVSRRPDEQGSG
jgi:hypothetical protein